MKLDITERLKLLARGDNLDLADIVCNDAVAEIRRLRARLSFGVVMKKLWGGFCEGELDIREMDTGFGGFGSGYGKRKIPAIFTSRKEACQEYEDVRPVKISKIQAASSRS